MFVFPRTDGVWFLVRRGGPFKREGSLERSETTSVYYRPEKYDVLKYDETLGELSVNTGGTKALIAVYRELFGAHLFGDADHFPGTGKFTLAPLQTHGEAALVCSDVDGIDWVKLKEVQTYWGGAEGEIEIRIATDVAANIGCLAALALMGERPQPSAALGAVLALVGITLMSR